METASFVTRVIPRKRKVDSTICMDYSLMILIMGLPAAP